jgi:ferredoxin
MPKVNFLREGIILDVPHGANLRKEALKAGVPLYRGATRIFNCRGLGTCGTCRVLLKNGTEGGASPKGLKERLRLALAMFAIGYEKELRLACQTRVLGDLDVQTQPPLNLYGVWQK